MVILFLEESDDLFSLDTKIIVDNTALAMNKFGSNGLDSYKEFTSLSPNDFFTPLTKSSYAIFAKKGPKKSKNGKTISSLKKDIQLF